MTLLFQSNPERWDLRGDLVPGEDVAWFVSRYQSFMRSGEIVLLWESKGKQKMAVKGLYGWGITLEKPQDYSGTLRIKLKYIERWISKTDSKNNVPKESNIAPIPGSSVLALSSWKDHLLAVMPIGTNFLVTDEQMEELLEKIVCVKFPESQLKMAFLEGSSGRKLDPNKFKHKSIDEKEKT